jgi:hypothetical protein
MQTPATLGSDVGRQSLPSGKKLARPPSSSKPTAKAMHCSGEPAAAALS